MKSQWSPLKLGLICIIRFGMFHPNRVHGIVTINNTASASLARFVEKMSEKLKVGKTEAGVKRLNVKWVVSNTIVVKSCKMQDWPDTTLRRNFTGYFSGMQRNLQTLLKIGRISFRIWTRKSSNVSSSSIVLSCFLVLICCS